MFEPFISNFPLLSLKSDVVQPYIVDCINPMNSKRPSAVKTYLTVEPFEGVAAPVTVLRSAIIDILPFDQVPTISLKLPDF